MPGFAGSSKRGRDIMPIRCDDRNCIRINLNGNLTFPGELWILGKYGRQR